jgi:hypothetical protein
MEVSLTNKPDKFEWKLTPSKQLTLQSIYEDFMSGHVMFLCNYLWNLKLPLKIMIFMWFVHPKVLLTRDNLTKRKWSGSTKCFFGSIEHLSIHVRFLKFVWIVVHFTFIITHPTNITNIFRNWLMELRRKLKLEFLWGFVL